MPDVIKPFEYLDNGALVLAAYPLATILQGSYEGTLCLCLYRSEYVVWMADEKRNAFWGHYFQSDIIEAVNFYKERTNHAV